MHMIVTGLLIFNNHVTLKIDKDSHTWHIKNHSSSIDRVQYLCAWALSMKQK